MRSRVDTPTLTGYAERIERDLRRNILPFWREHAVAATDTGFVGAMTNDLVVDPQAERGMLLTARILWTFAAAFKRYRTAEDRRMADRAYAELCMRFADPVHGGFWWSVGADGAVAQSRKQIYGQAFAVYALSEYSSATGNDQARERAVATFDLIERFARDGEHEGYWEAFDEHWAPIADVRLSEVDLNEPKSQNTHLHLLEAYTTLLRVWPQARVRAALENLVELMLNRIVGPRGHLGLFFAPDWVSRSKAVSFGHDIEASWLLTAATETLGNKTLSEHARPQILGLAELTLQEGVDADGGLLNGAVPGEVVDTRKEWWLQAEAMVGFLNAFELSGEERYLTAALRGWDFIERRLIDRRHGEWFRGVTRDGEGLPHELKVSFWKCPYHNGRAALEATRRLRALTGT